MSHTQTTHTHTQHPPSFCVAGVALMVLGGALGPDLSPGAPRHFAWQAWHLVTSTFVSRGRRGTNSTSTVLLRGRRGTHGTGWRAWPGFVARGAAPLCVTGVALGHIHPRFTWQAWHELNIHRPFAWQAWHSWYWVAHLARICRPGRRATLRGRRGTWSHPPSFHVAGVARTQHPPSFCVAGVALMLLGGALGPDLSPGAPRHFAWQAWHLVIFTFVSRGRRGTNSTSTVLLRGRRGTHATGWRAWPGFVARGAAPLCVVGVALGDIHLRFTWQAWHSVTFTFHVAGVAQLHIHGRFAWQAWHQL